MSLQATLTHGLPSPSIVIVIVVIIIIIANHPPSRVRSESDWGTLAITAMPATCSVIVRHLKRSFAQREGRERPLCTGLSCIQVKKQTYRCDACYPSPTPTPLYPSLPYHFPTLPYPTPPRREKLVKLRFMFPEPIMDWPTCIQVEKHPYRCDLSSNLARAPRLDQSIFLFVIDLVIVIASVVVMIFCVGVSMSLQATLTHGLTHLSVAILAQAALTVSPRATRATFTRSLSLRPTRRTPARRA